MNRPLVIEEERLNFDIGTPQEEEMAKENTDVHNR